MKKFLAITAIISLVLFIILVVPADARGRAGGIGSEVTEETICDLRIIFLFGGVIFILFGWVIYMIFSKIKKGGKMEETERTEIKKKLAELEEGRSFIFAGEGYHIKGRKGRNNPKIDSAVFFKRESDRNGDQGSILIFHPASGETTSAKGEEEVIEVEIRLERVK